MKKILGALLSCWCGCALAQTAQELIDNGKNSENVTTFGMGYHLNQYSPLSQINKSNVKRLIGLTQKHYGAGAINNDNRSRGSARSVCRITLGRHGAAPDCCTAGFQSR